jgi:DedD protein
MAKQISNEEETNLKRQARRRLIGAAVLVLAIVVILPMIFDSEPSPAITNDIELRIPDKDNAPVFQVQTATKAVTEVASSVSPAPVADATKNMPASAVSIAPLTGLNIKTEQPDSKPKSETKSISRPLPQSGWVVQIGAYSNADTARHLQAKLNQLGYHAYTEKAGNNLRVRIGSYPTSEAAEKIKRKLEAQGLHPNVVNVN